MTITAERTEQVQDFDTAAMSTAELEEAINAFIGHTPMPQSLITELELRRAHA